tara:strand:+ start:1339 stop:3405 length:2067 start_codon:yes stop_codon:yes gene_type:complete
MAKVDSTQYGSEPANEEPIKYDKNYWKKQFDNVEENFRQTIRRAEAATNKYEGNKDVDDRSTAYRSINLFHADSKTLERMLYGQIPSVRASRRYADPKDDNGRVAANIMERLLNNDLEDNGKEFSATMRNSIQDWLVPGGGFARVYYEAQYTDEPVIDPLTSMPMIDPETNEAMIEKKLVFQDAPVRYLHWRDVRWGWSRTYENLPWQAFRSYLTYQDAKARFSAEKAGQMQYEKQTTTDPEAAEQDPETDDKSLKAEVWEIWCKKTKKVYWYNENCRSLLDEKTDPLKLSGFWPMPPALISNATTSFYMYNPDYFYTQDLYLAVDRLEMRIGLITDAIRAAGVYDKSQGADIGRLMKETGENDLIPVDSWAVFAEKGGLAGAIDWMPIQELANVLAILNAEQQTAIGKLHQVTGMSDIMRGASTNQGAVSATERSIQSRYSSISIQDRQDETARFATDLLQLKAEVISIHFEAETILARSNILRTDDAKYATKAVELIKDTEDAEIRIKIQSESMAMADYAVLKQERTEFIQSMGFFVQSAQNLPPPLVPGALKMLQWGLAGFKGSSEIEGVVDDMIKTFEDQLKQPPPKEPNPEEIKNKNKMAEENLKHQNKMKELATSHQIKMQQDIADFKLEMAKLQASGVQDRELEKMQAVLNSMENNLQSANKLKEIYAQADVKLRAVGNDG